MNFLGLFDIPTNFLDVIKNMLLGVVYFIAELIYPIIIHLYDLFSILIKGRLLDNEIMQTLSDRIGLLLGIVMFFIVIISAIQMMLDPDKVNDKEKGAASIIGRVLIVIVMFGFSSFAFDTLYYVQEVVIESNAINKILIPYEVDDDNFGTALSYTLFKTFYHVDSRLDNDNSSDVQYCKLIMSTELRESVENRQDFSIGKDCVGKMTEISTGEKIYIMEFNWLLMILVGAFVVYFLFTYCISVGIRMIQLTFLEIISPMAFVSYLSPKKDNMFGKWFKLYFATFLDAFIRIAIISFSVFLISMILSDMSEWYFWESLDVNNLGFWSKTFIYIIMIFAILSFAKKAPDLIKDLFPSGASKLGLGVGSPKKLFDGMLGGNLVKGGLTGVAGFGVGAGVGAIGNMFRGAMNDKDNRLRGLREGLMGGLISGGMAGAKAKGIGKAFGASNKAASAQNQRLNEWRANGGVSGFSRFTTGVQQRLGLATEAEILDLEKADIEAENSIYNQFSGYFDAAKGRAEKKILEGKLTGKSAAADATLAASRRMEILKQQAGNLDKSDKRFQKQNNDGTYSFDDSKYKAELDGILDEINKQQAIYNDNLKQATRDYFAEAISDKTFDAVINQNMDMANGVLENNRHIKSLENLDFIDYDSFDKANNKVKDAVTENTVKLSENQRKGKEVRADAKYNSGSKK